MLVVGRGRNRVGFFFSRIGCQMSNPCQLPHSFCHERPRDFRCGWVCRCGKVAEPYHVSVGAAQHRPQTVWPSRISLISTPPPRNRDLMNSGTRPDRLVSELVLSQVPALATTAWPLLPCRATRFGAGSYVEPGEKNPTMSKAQLGKRSNDSRATSSGRIGNGHPVVRRKKRSGLLLPILCCK